MNQAMKFSCHKLTPIVATAISAAIAMVASFSALGGSAPQPDTAGIAGYYAGADYYAGEGGAVSRWFGGGSAALGLAGPVCSWQLECTQAGVHPVTRQQLVQIQRQKGKAKKPGKGKGPDDEGGTAGDPHEKPKRRDRNPGVDICLTPPKSVSAFIAALPAPLREKFLAAIDRAAERTIGLAETDLLVGRSGKGGWRKENPKLVIGIFRELVNRSLEPNVHYHCVISNLALYADGKWRTINTKILRDWARTIGPIFRSALAKELRELGLELEQGTKAGGQEAGWFEIKGVPEALIKQWSSRRQQIEKAVDGDGQRFGDASSQAKQQANLSTRRTKQQTPPEAELFDRWQQQAAAAGLTAQAAERLIGKAKPVDVEAAYQEAWDKAISKLNHEYAYFTERHITQLVCEAGQVHGLDGIEVKRRIHQALHHSPAIVPRGELAGEQQFTTRETWELEQKLLNTVGQMQNRPGARVSDRAVERILKKHKTLNSEQQAAVRHLLTDDSAIKVLTGVAGAGKSTSLLAVKSALTKTGYTCLGGALAGAAKEELVAKTGMPSRTVASYLWHLEKSPWRKVRDEVRHAAKQILRAALGKKTYGPTKVKFDSRTVLFLDECGMLDTRTLYRIVQQVEKAKGTIVMTGDVAQLPPILAGGPFKHFTQNLPHAHLSKNERQQNVFDQQAVADIREGRIKEALRSYAERGLLTVGSDKETAIKQLVAEWSRSGGVEKPKEHVIFTQTRQEAAAVNRACQQERQRFGAVKSYGGIKVGDERVFEGDRVLFHKPLRKWGIENGHRATVLKTNRVTRTITVELDHQPTALPGQKPRSKIVTIPLRSIGKDGLTLGMAATTHKMQGQTCEHSYVLTASRLASKEMAYVQTTRGRQSTKLFTTAHHAGQDLTILSQTLKRSVAKDLAHDLPEPKQRPQREQTHELRPQF